MTQLPAIRMTWALLVRLGLVVGEILLRGAASATGPICAEPASAKCQLLTPSFIENVGQWAPEVRFVANFGGQVVAISEHGALIAPLPRAKAGGTPFRLTFTGATGHRAQGRGCISGRFNFFLGNDPSRWCSRVRRFAEVWVPNVYPGIGVRWYFQRGSPRYDIVAAPRADLSKVALSFGGGSSLVAEGPTAVAVVRKDSSLSMRDLAAYQPIGRKRTHIRCRFVLNRGAVGFCVSGIDPRLPIVIDPLVFSTLIGGTRLDSVNAVALDSRGNILIAGSTTSPDFPVTSDAYKTQNAPAQLGDPTAFMAKFNPDGSKLLYATFFGGSGQVGGYGDIATSLCVDERGNIAIAGSTYSTDFPTTTNALQQTNEGWLTWFCTGFVARFDPTGENLLASTYLGGRGRYYGDRVNAMALDSDGNPVVVGTTFSSDFPTSALALQGLNRAYVNYGGNGFVAKVSADATHLIFSTYLGGSVDDSALAVCLDHEGDILVAGETASEDFPTSRNAYQRTSKGIATGNETAFVTALESSGSRILYSTLLGGSGGDSAQAIVAAHDGSAYVAGWTYSRDFPMRVGSFQMRNNGFVVNSGNSFVARISADGESLLSSTYLGGHPPAGTSGDLIAALSSDTDGNLIVAGSAFSNDFPTTSSGVQRSNRAFGDVSPNAFVAKLKPSLSAMIYGTYLGGAGGGGEGDGATTVAAKGDTDLIVAGDSYSRNFPVSPSAYHKTNTGWPNVFVAGIQVPATATQRGAGR